MKYLFILITLFTLSAKSQTIYRITADSTKIWGGAETVPNQLIIVNSTKDTTFGVLTNVINGRTQFRKLRLVSINDTTFQLLLGTQNMGTVTIVGSGGGGGSSYTASNGITLTGTNFKWGGTLVNATSIDQMGFDLGIGTLAFGILANTTGTTGAAWKTVDTTYFTGISKSLPYSAQTVASYGSNYAGVLAASDVVQIIGFNNTTGSTQFLVTPTKQTFVGLPPNNTALKVLVQQPDSSSAWRTVASITSGLGSGTVTSVSQGNGITNTPNPITSTGTVAVDTSVIGSKTYIDSKIAQQSLALSVATDVFLTLSPGNTVNLGRPPVDTIYLNAAGDSIVYFKGGSRYAIKIPTGTVTSIATTDSTGINGGTINTTGTLSLDTTRVVVSKKYLDSKLASVGSGVSALSAIGASPNANGATITGSTLNLEPADATFGGVWTAGTQTLAGNKTLTGSLTLAAGTTTLAPLIMQSGTNLTTAVAGRFEYNGTSLYFTRSGTLRAGVIMSDLLTPFNTYSAGNKGATAFTTGSSNILLGNSAGAPLTGGVANIVIGRTASQTGNPNMSLVTIIGGDAANQGLTIGDGSTIIGAQCGKLAVPGAAPCVIIGNGSDAGGAYSISIGSEVKSGTGGDNISMGYQSGGALASTGLGNVCIGRTSGTSMSGAAARNVLIGYQTSNALTTASKCIIIGNDIDPQSNTTDGQLSIGNLIFGGSLDGTGTTVSSGSVSIGTATQDAKALLTLSSTTKGLLLMRMTSTQASAIATPPDGLMLYVTDTDATFTAVGFWGRENGAWVKL